MHAVQEAHAAYASMHSASADQLRSASALFTQHCDASASALAALSTSTQSLASLRADIDSSVREWTAAAVGLFSGMREHAEETFAEVAKRDDGRDAAESGSRGEQQQLRAPQERVMDAVLRVRASLDTVAVQQSELEVRHVLALCLLLIQTTLLLVSGKFWADGEFALLMCMVQCKYFLL
jgi:hypothetical protein